jgi:hypothetical protein
MKAHGRCRGALLDRAPQTGGHAAEAGSVGRRRLRSGALHVSRPSSLLPLSRTWDLPARLSRSIESLSCFGATATTGPRGHRAPIFGRAHARPHRSPSAGAHVSPDYSRRCLLRALAGVRHRPAGDVPAGVAARASIRTDANRTKAHVACARLHCACRERPGGGRRSRTTRS